MDQRLQEEVHWARDKLMRIQQPQNSVIQTPKDQVPKQWSESRQQIHLDRQKIHVYHQ
jgi:hypothetical protein